MQGVLYLTQRFQAACVEQVSDLGAEARIRGDEAVERLFCLLELLQTES